ncbi:MAG: polyprenyl synthetase family protein [Spirochaetaceae bacterium]|nr:polyprenyl synthetase family protein [Spirochaetaceae bacterium]
MDALSERIARIEKVLLSVLPDNVDSAWLNRVAGGNCPEASPVWADSFLDPGRELMRRGGKRWRPLVTILSCEALGGGRVADLLTPLTEIPHNGSLIVDDIEDASLTRRGGPAIHTVFGEDLAINMGNLMYFLPSIVLERTTFSDTTLSAITRDWLSVMRRLHLGQGYDILWHREAGLFPDEDSYLRMCRFKTGSLASLSAILGARAAADRSSGRNNGISDITEALVQALGKAWEDLGTGFQILDDVQNLSSGIPGKDRGDDIVEGKKSLPVILHAASRPEDIPRLIELFAEAAENTPGGDWKAVEEAIALLESSGAIAEAREKGRDLLANGRSAIEGLLPESEGRELMLGLVDGFVEKMV